jgi:hypothetical protein
MEYPNIVLDIICFVVGSLLLSRVISFELKHHHSVQKGMIQKSPRLSFSAERNQGHNDGGTDFLVLMLLLYSSLLECQTYSS